MPVERIVPLGSELLRRGVPCILEKPPGATAAEVAALVQVARETGTPHQISVNRRFSPFLNRAIAWAKEAGSVQYVHGRMVRDARREGDFVWGTGVHIIDAMRHIGGEWEDFEVRTVEPPRTSAPWFLIALRFASGCEGTVEMVPTAGMMEETYDLYGDGFRATATTMGGLGESVRCWRNGTLEVEMRADPGAPTCLRDGSYEEVEAFVSALNQGVMPHPGVEEVAPTMDLCTQIHAALGGKEG
jgi:predicted dehydrogenase